MSTSSVLSPKDVWQKREAAIKRTGDMMLGGWKMLATHCPICNSALLQKELKVQCASCNMPVMTEEQYSARPSSDQSAKTVSIANPPVSATDSQTALGTADSMAQNSKNILSSKTEAAAAVIDVPNSTHSTNNTASSLSESIANTRKLQETQETFLSVDNFDGYYSDNDNIGVTNTLEAEKKEYDRKNKQRDVISVKLGEKMLSGWTLLAAVCPSSGCFSTPLMSMKGQAVTCVACNGKYRISTYDDSYEEIIDKDKDKDTGKIAKPENNPNSSMNSNKNQSNIKPVTESQSNIKPTTVESQDPGSEFLSPMFDLSDAPILDFSNSFSSNSSSDPSSLISKKLIKGWTLLDAVCESSVCEGCTPLVKDREGLTHCVVCGYTKGKDGKVINEGSDTFLTPVPVPVSAPASSSLPFTRQITPKAADNNLNSIDKDSKSKTLLSKRKDTAHDDYDEEDIDELENDNDNDDDDEDADDSVAFSKYVHARMKESEKPSKVANFGSEKQYTVSSTVTKKIASHSSNDSRTQLAKTEKVLSTVFSKIEYFGELLENNTNVTECAKLAECIRYLADAASGVLKLKRDF